MAKTETDRRVLRTRALLLDAFRSLMIERSYDTITVQHLLERGGVGRATFYAHFRDKEELLVTSLERLRISLRSAWKSANVDGRTGEPLGFVLPFFQHLDSHRRIYHLSIAHARHAPVETYIRRMLSNLVREDLLSRRLIRPRGTSSEAVVEYAAAAIWSLAAWWMSSRARLSPEELDRLARTLVLPGLEATLSLRPG